MKKLLFNQEARNKLAAGADILAKAVVSTLGPRSRNVAIARKPYAPFVVHDGVTVAKSVVLKDPFEAVGADLLREAASKTNDLAGDGTTTATLIANTLVQEGLKMVGGDFKEGLLSAKHNPMEIKEWLDLYSRKINLMLDKRAKKLKKGDAQKVAQISAGSKDVADLVSKAIDKVGADGLVMVERTQALESTVEFQKGMEFENGYLSPYFVTDANKMVVSYDDAYVLLTDSVIADPMALVSIIEAVWKEGQQKKALLIVAGDVVGPAMSALILTKQKQGVPLVAVMAPEFAERRKEMLQDIAVLTGARVFSKERGDDISNAKLSDLGRVSTFITKTHTLITPLFPDEEELKERAEAIREQIKEEDNAFRKERMEYRLAKLTQSVGIVNVGGASESEVNEKAERVIDAVYATRAAISEGIVPGGGVALRDIAYELADAPEEALSDGVGHLIVLALKAPYERILVNSGMSVEVAEAGFGFDVISKKKVDMVEAGIIDPVKVTKLAISHAFSVAGMILTTDTLIVDDVDESVQKIRVVNNEGN